MKYIYNYWLRSLFSELLVEPKAISPIAVPVAVKERPKSNPFHNWRSDAVPEIKFEDIHIPFEDIGCPPGLREQVQMICFNEYKHAMNMLEHSVCEASHAYITHNPFSKEERPFVDKLRSEPTKREDQAPEGPVMAFANVFVQRYFDLYEAYIQMEMENNIPMLPVTAGQMKTHGFTTTTILKMQSSCAEFSNISNEILALVGKDHEKYAQIMEVVTNNNKSIKRNDVLKDPKQLEDLLSFETNPTVRGKLIADCVALFKRYDALPENSLIDKAHFLMHDFAHMEYSEIATQLYYVGIMVPDYHATKENRLLMEIRHRVGGDSSIPQNAPGSLGSNPLAYLNILRHGEPGNPRSEFMTKMYFVYMSNHFANAVIENDANIQYINTWLSEHGKGWNLSEDFIQAMKDRGPSYIPPIFRYASNAALNKQLRMMATKKEVSEFYEHYPNITIREAVERTADINAHYNATLSPRELMNQIGELTWNSRDANRPWTRLNYGTGAAIFRLIRETNKEMSESAKAYIDTVERLGLPVYAGISGTLDQSTAMAGLVGLGVDSDLHKREREFQTIKLAYLAFMLPGRDHSVHEILQSSRSYGLDYAAGPGYQKYIFPPDQTAIEQMLNDFQSRRGCAMPEYYLSKEYAKKVLTDLQTKKPVITFAAPKPTEKDKKSPSQEDRPFYYIGFVLLNTDLDHSINQINDNFANDMVAIDSKNRHITIGWFEEALSPKQLQKVSEILKAIFAKYNTLQFQIDKVRGGEDQADILLDLKETTDQLTLMQQEIQKSCKEIGVTFEFSTIPHVKIGYCEDRDQKAKMRSRLKTVTMTPAVDQLYAFLEVSMLHYDRQRGLVAKDYNYPFGTKSVQPTKMS